MASAFFLWDTCGQLVSSFFGAGSTHRATWLAGTLQGNFHFFRDACRKPAFSYFADFWRISPIFQYKNLIFSVLGSVFPEN